MGTGMSTTVIGIDPGLDGGLVALIPNQPPSLCVMPSFRRKTGREIDELRVVHWLSDFVATPVHVCIEAVHAMPNQGVRSMFTFGTGWGQIRGICAGLRLPYELVRPQEWQRGMLAGQPKGSEYLVASRLWPSIRWQASTRCRKPHDGLVDAALIAEFSRRRAGY